MISHRGNVDDATVVCHDHLGHHQDAKICVSFYLLDIYVPENVYIWCPWGEGIYCLICLFYQLLFIYWNTTNVSLTDHSEGFILYLFTTSNVYMHITLSNVIILFWNAIVYLFVTKSYHVLVEIGFQPIVLYWRNVGMISVCRSSEIHYGMLTKGCKLSFEFDFYF